MKALDAATELKTKDFVLSKLDKLIISAHAIFEGVGIAGLISAAFWYTTAPIAPDGFKGPISTYTIATTTIISLFLAVPIARMSYKKLIRDMGTLYAELSLEMRKCLYSYYELLYELLKLRSVHETDEQFIEHSEFLKVNLLESNTLISGICQRF
ncbi:MAG: hypothetical protein EPN84_01190 [Legionella sp.]|nr:MAG: hypothetical protein EPN84_01190 [Legionella sp.]